MAKILGFPSSGKPHVDVKIKEVLASLDGLNIGETIDVLMNVLFQVNYMTFKGYKRPGPDREHALAVLLDAEALIQISRDFINTGELKLEQDGGIQTP